MNAEKLHRTLQLIPGATLSTKNGMVYAVKRDGYTVHIRMPGTVLNCENGYHGLWDEEAHTAPTRPEHFFLRYVVWKALASLRSYRPLKPRAPRDQTGRWAQRHGKLNQNTSGEA
jgi:hypothetical protein